MSEIINEDVEFNSYLVGNGYGEWLLSQEDDEASWRKTMQQAIDEEEYADAQTTSITSTVTSKQLVEKYMDILQKRNDEQNKLRDALVDLESLKTDLNTDHIKEVTFDIANSLGSIRMGLFGRDKVTGDITKLAKVLHDNLPGDNEDEKQKYLNEIFPEISKEGNNIMAFYKAERGIVGATANYIREHGFKAEMRKTFYDVTKGPARLYYTLSRKHHEKLEKKYLDKYHKIEKKRFVAEERRRHVRALISPRYKFVELSEADKMDIRNKDPKLQKLALSYAAHLRASTTATIKKADMEADWKDIETTLTKQYREKHNLDHFYDTTTRDRIVQQIGDKEKEIDSIRSEIDKLEGQRGNLADLITYLDNYSINDVPMLSDEEFEKACAELAKQKEIEETYTEYEPIEDEAYDNDYSDADIVSDADSFGGNSLEKKLEENKQKIEALKKANKEIQKEIKSGQNKGEQDKDKSSKEKKSKKTKEEER